MGYERIVKPEGVLYHYTKRENLRQIIKDGRIRKFKSRESWFCSSLENVLRLMEMTVMQEGNLYYDAGGILRRYPPFEAEDYIILELVPRFQNGECMNITITSKDRQGRMLPNLSRRHWKITLTS